MIDDWGLKPLTCNPKNLIGIMDDRYQQSAILMVSQLPTEQYQTIGDHILADAISD